MTTDYVLAAIRQLLPVSQSGRKVAWSHYCDDCADCRIQWEGGYGPDDPRWFRYPELAPEGHLCPCACHRAAIERLVSGSLAADEAAEVSRDRLSRRNYESAWRRALRDGVPVYKKKPPPFEGGGGGGRPPDPPPRPPPPPEDAMVRLQRRLQEAVQGRRNADARGVSMIERLLEAPVGSRYESPVLDADWELVSVRTEEE